MSIVILGKSKCLLCEKVLGEDDRITGFSAFLPYDHKYGKFSDAAMHESCYLSDPDHDAVSDMFYVHQKIFDQAWKESKEIEGNVHDKEAYIAKAFTDAGWPPKNGVVIYEQVFTEDGSEAEWFWADKDMWEEFEKAEAKAHKEMEERREEAYRRDRAAWRYMRDDD